MEFDFISKVQISTVITGFVFTCLLAFLGLGVYSLVFGQLLQVVLTQGIFFAAGRRQQKVLLYCNVREVGDFIRIGGFQLGAQVLDFASAKIDVFLIGRFFGMDDLGIYNLAKELILKPYQIVNSLVNSVASAAFAKIQGNLQAVKRNYANVVRMITTISIPAYVCIFVFADVIVGILYAPEFSEVAVFLRILTLVGIGSSINSPCGILQTALGRTDIGFKWTTIRVSVSALSILAASAYTIYTVAYVQMAIAVVFFFIYWRIAVLPLSHIRLGEYFAVFGKAAVSAVLMGVPFFLIVQTLHIPLWIGCLLMALYLLLYGLYHKKYLFENFRLLARKRK